MKYLSDYIQEKQTQLFNQTGAFFAFSNDQFNEEKKEDINYVSLNSGLICPKDQVEILTNGLTIIHTEGIAQDLTENGKDAIIERELFNHEAFYTGDLEDTIYALSDYGFNHQDIIRVYRLVAPTVDC